MLLTTFLLMLGSEKINGTFFNNYGSWLPYSLQVSGEEVVLISKEEVNFLNLEGSRTREVKMPFEEGYLFPSCFFRAGDDILLGAFNGSQWVLAKIDSNGTLIAESPVVYMQLLEIEGRLFGVKIPERRAFSPVLREIDPETLREGKSFFRKPDGFDVAGIPALLWAVELPGYHLVALSASKRIYIVGEGVAEKESRIGKDTPSSYPYRELDLPGFIQASALDHAPSLMTEEDKIIYYGKNMILSSMVVFFGALNDGFVICYTVPDELDGIVVGNHVAIRFLDSALKPVGPVLERYGQVAGVNEDGLVIFYPDGPEPPVTAEGMRAHYGVDRIESREQLIALYSRFRALEKRTLNPVIEVIPAP